MATWRWRAAALLLCLVSLRWQALGQSVDKAVLNSTVWITYQENAAQAKSASATRHAAAPTTFGGTGFLLFQGIGYTKGSVYLITNKHLLPKPGIEKSIHLRVAVRDPNGSRRVQEVEVPIVGSNGKYLDSVRLHPNPETDVAAVNITSIALGAKMQLLVDAVLNHRCLDVSMLMTSERLQNSSVGPGTPVYVVGFPAALFDPRNVSPLLRIGYVSSEPREGFSFNPLLREKLHLPEHIDGFLIDANVYPGTSGSVVILANAATPGADATATQPLILGIVGGSIPIFDESLQSYERIGLGVVYSANAIAEVLKSFAN